MTETFEVPPGTDFFTAYAEHRARHPDHVFVTAVEVPADSKAGTPAQLIAITRRIDSNTNSERL